MWPIIVVGTVFSGVSMLPYILNERSDAWFLISGVVGHTNLGHEGDG